MRGALSVSCTNYKLFLDWMGSRGNLNTIQNTSDYSDYQSYITNEVLIYFWCLQNTESRLVEGSYDFVQRLSKGGAEEANYVTSSK